MKRDLIAGVCLYLENRHMMSQAERDTILSLFYDVVSQRFVNVESGVCTDLGPAFMNLGKDKP